MDFWCASTGSYSWHRHHNDTDKDEKAEAKSINENREPGSENTIDVDAKR